MDSHHFDQNNKPKNSSLLMNIVYESASDSTTHGLPHIFKRKHVSIKMFWLICFLISSGVCGYMIVKSVINYFEHETVSKVQRIYEIPALFPTISVCNLNAFTTNAGLDYVRSELDYIYTDTSNLKQQLTYGFWTAILRLKYFMGVRLRDPSYTDSYRRSMSLQMDDMLLWCTYNGKPCTPNDFVWYFDSIYG